MALYYEDFEIGQQFTTAARTITETDVVLFSGLTGDFNPLHTDIEYSKKTIFKERIAHGLLVLSVVAGLTARLGIFDGTVIGVIEVKSNFRKPVFFNDSIYANIKIAEKIPTSKSDRGIIAREVKVINQRDEIVQEIEIKTMVMKRPV